MKRLFTTIIAALAVSAASASANTKDVFLESKFDNKSSIFCPAVITQRGLVLGANHCTQSDDGIQSREFVVHIGAQVDLSGTNLVGGDSFNVPSDNHFPQKPGTVFSKEDAAMLGNDAVVFFSPEIREKVKTQSLGWNPERYPTTGHDANGYDEQKPFYIRLPGQKYVKCEQKGTSVKDAYGVRPAHCPKSVIKGHSGSPAYQKSDDNEYQLVGFVTAGDTVFPGDKKKYILIQTLDPNKTVEIMKSASNGS